MGCICSKSGGHGAQASFQVPFERKHQPKKSFPESEMFESGEVDTDRIPSQPVTVNDINGPEDARKSSMVKSSAKSYTNNGIVETLKAQKSDSNMSAKGAVPDAQPLDDGDIQSLFSETWQYKVKAAGKKQKQNMKLEQLMKKSIAELDIRIPVQHVKGNQYLLGHLKTQVEIKDNKLQLRIKGEQMSIEEFKERIEQDTRAIIAQFCKAKNIDLKKFAQKAIAGDKDLQDLESPHVMAPPA